MEKKARLFSEKMKNYDLIIFDMDGTILDTLEDLQDSLNYALKQMNYPERSYQEVRSFVGNGLANLVRLAVPKDTNEELQQEVLTILKSYYSVHCQDKTKPYEGICELLLDLRAHGYKTAVVSNKVDSAVHQLCEEYFTGLFDMSIGERSDLNRKPAPDAVLEVLKVLNVPKERALYIGDSEVDVLTAKNSMLDMITVTWGFRDKEMLLLHGATNFADTMDDVRNYLNVL